MEEITLTLNKPITEEEWDMITDVDLDHTSEVLFHTKHGKKVRFVKEPHWVPCSERLPEENEVVLTQARFADDIKMAVSARIDYNYWTGWGTREVNVVAWMPLPPVYQEEDNK